MLLIDNKIQFLLQKALIVAGVAFLVSGWWFIRNAIIYNGDFLGLKTSNMYAEKYARPDLLPNKKGIIHSDNSTLGYMLFEKGWIRSVLYSFVGTFSYMTLPMEHAVSWLFFLIPILSMGNYIFRTKKKSFNMFYFLMFLMCVITIALNMYYSFFSDFQP
jgi:hypothetical protein